VPIQCHPSHRPQRAASTTSKTDVRRMAAGIAGQI
jgi:hypothetical protein